MLGPPAPFDSDTPAGSSGARPPGMPRWVKLFAAGIIALILLAVVVLLVSGGEHGPSRHGAQAIGGDAPALSTTLESQRR